MDQANTDARPPARRRSSPRTLRAAGSERRLAEAVDFGRHCSPSVRWTRRFAASCARNVARDVVGPCEVMRRSASTPCAAFSPNCRLPGRRQATLGEWTVVSQLSLARARYRHQGPPRAGAVNLIRGLAPKRAAGSPPGSALDAPRRRLSRRWSTSSSPIRPRTASACATLVGEIERLGCSVWWDREIDAGATFDREIEKNIDEAKLHRRGLVEELRRIRLGAQRGARGPDRGNLVPVAIETVRPPLAFRLIPDDRPRRRRRQRQPDQRHRQAVSRSPPRGRRSPCVGRAREFGRIGEAVDRARRGEGAPAAVLGEAGVGKTRMTLEAERIARAAGVLALRGHCSDAESPPPYQPLVEQIERVARLVGPARRCASAWAKTPPSLAS